MAARGDAIRLKPPGDEGKGVEVRLGRGGIREYHQVKRQHDEGRWTLAMLKQADVLENFRAKLRQGGGRAPDRRLRPLALRLQAETAAGLLEGRRHLPAMDEPGHKLRGRRRLAATVRRRYAWLYAYGFVQPITGRTWWCLLPTVGVEAFGLALAEFARDEGIGPGRRCWRSTGPGGTPPRI